MRSIFKTSTSIFFASLLAASALTVSGAHAEQMNGGLMKPTPIDNGNGGWTPPGPDGPQVGPKRVSTEDRKGRPNCSAR
jgi:hypothetical protein